MSDTLTCTFRQLKPADVRLMKELLRVFADAFNESEAYLHAVPSDAYLARLLGRRHFIALVAMHGKAVVGGLAAYVLDKFELDRREIYVYDLAVSEQHRRQGVATGLFGALNDIAVKRSAYVILVQADVGDAPAFALYQSLGTTQTVHHFDIAVRLKPHSSPPAAPSGSPSRR